MLVPPGWFSLTVDASCLDPSTHMTPMSGEI